MMIPENAPVRLLNAQLEELEYGKLYEAYSSKGRKSAAEPRVLFKVLVHGYLCGIYSSRKLEEACQYRIDFRWLLEDRKAPDHSTLSRFRTGRCKEAVEDLFYQFVRKLEGMGETDHKAVFLDGTKLESRAGRYTFVWRKSVEKQLARVKEKLKALTGLTTSAAVRALLQEEAKGIEFVSGKGSRKSQAQRDWEEKQTLLERWERYEEMLSTMGEGRNSYSKTDPEATFMRMKEDHMRNGQLKPGYNVQIAVNSEYITGIEAFSDRTDVRTLRPMLEQLSQWHRTRYEEVVTDAGYESLENYLYLEQNGQMCFIKPTNYDQKRTKKRTASPAPRAGSCICGGRPQKSGTNSWYPPPGTGAKIAAAVPAGHSAAGPRTRTSPRNLYCGKPSGKNGSRQRKISGRNVGSICVFAAPSRWRARLAC